MMQIRETHGTRGVVITRVAKSMVSQRGTQFPDGERIILDRKYHAEGGPGGRSRREERIRGPECSYHEDLRRVWSSVAFKVA